MKVISKRELDELSSWLSEQQAPEGIRAIVDKFFRLNQFVDSVVSKNNKLLHRLREALGITPKSERGGQTKRFWGIS